MADFAQTTADEKMDIVFVGHVDHGKSTVIGRLLADTGSLPEGRLASIKQQCALSNQPFEYAYLIDALKDERAQSITIDAARVFFKSPKRRYIIIDAPGHIEFIRNMVTGASHAESALLVIDAEEGVQENSRRHGYLLWMLGIKQLVVLINKMDLVEYDQHRFEQVRDEYSSFLSDIELEPLAYIPVSGHQGDGIAQNNGRMQWYKGPTLLEAVDNFRKAPPLDQNPLRMPVQDVYKFSQFGDRRRIVAGSISTGSLRLGDEIVFYPSGKRSTVASIEAFGSSMPKMLGSGQAGGFTLEEQIYIKRGEVACKPGETMPSVTRRFRASLFWLGKQPLQTNRDYILKLGTSRVRAQIVEIHRVVDASNLEALDKNAIEYHDVAEVTFVLQHAIAFDSPTLCADTSRFVIVDNYEIWGGGIVISPEDDDEDRLRHSLFTRQQKWIKSAVDIAQRAERYNQNPVLIIITGKQNSGRKRTAIALEKLLFHEGKHVYYLGLGSILYGLSLDLKQGVEDETTWSEHLRRIAEVAYMFLDAGLILIMTAVEINMSDILQLNTLMNGNRVKTVWVGGDPATEQGFDLITPKDLEPENTATIIKEALQQQGIVFTPWSH